MSHSSEERLQNADLALRLMMQELGDRAFDELEFEPDEELLRDVFPTTWKLLEDRMLVRACPTMTTERYVLSAYGWLKGIELLDRLDEVKQSVGRIMSAVKERIKGRRDEAFVSASESANEAGVSFAFLTNITECDFITRVLGRKGLIAQRHMCDTMLTVPIDFGLELL